MLRVIIFITLLSCNTGILSAQELKERETKSFPYYFVGYANSVNIIHEGPFELNDGSNAVGYVVNRKNKEIYFLFCNQKGNWYDEDAITPTTLDCDDGPKSPPTSPYAKIILPSPNSDGTGVVWTLTPEEVNAWASGIPSPTAPSATEDVVAIDNVYCKNIPSELKHAFINDCKDDNITSPTIIMPLKTDEMKAIYDTIGVYKVDEIDTNSDEYKAIWQSAVMVGGDGLKDGN